MTTLIWGIAIVIFASFIGAFGSLFLKKGASKLALSLNSIFRNKSLITGILMYVIGTLLFVPALRLGDLSVLYPFASLTYVWTVLISIKFLKEKMNSFKWIGLILLIIGVTFIGLGSG